MLKMKLKTISKLLLILTVISVVAVSGQDVTRLVRIKSDDNWIYETNGIRTKYQVLNTTLNEDGREVNKLQSNATTPSIPFDNWNDGNFSMNIEFIEFVEYYTSRGNFPNDIDGTINVTLDFGNYTTSVIAIGELWNNGGDYSFNDVVVTGDPKNTLFELTVTEITNDTELWIHILNIYTIYPSEEYITTWEGNDVTVIDLTQYLIDSSITVVCYVGNETYEYFYSQEMNVIKNKYVYAETIGLPIEVTKYSDNTVLNLKTKINQIDDTQKLVNFNIDETKFEVKINGTDFSLISLLAIPFIALKRKN